MNKPLDPELDRKYAQMWVESNSNQVPSGIEPFKSHGPLNDEQVTLFSEACWMVLNMMAKDGLITRAGLREAYDIRQGWKPGRSKIQVGYVPEESKTPDQKSGAVDHSEG